MIAHGVQIPFWLVAWFYVRSVFFVYCMPVLLGFLVATIYPMGQRVAMHFRPFLTVWLCNALGPTIMLVGWQLVARGLHNAPLYGLGYGLGVAILSRVRAIHWGWMPRVIWRGSQEDLALTSRRAVA